MVHLQENGFEVDVAPPATRPELAKLREQAGIPDDAAGCHTAFVDGYAVEGHVPADVIHDLLRRRPPDVTAIAVPGMPHGSPGMETGRHDPYTVVALHRDGTRSEFAHR